MKLPDKYVAWGASIIVTVAMAVGFLFITFQTKADADKSQNYIQSRLDIFDQKLDKLIDQTK